MKKFIFLAVFLFLAFLYGSVKAADAQALTYHSSTLTNNSGLSLNVYYYIENENGRVAINGSTATRTVPVAAGTFVNDQPTQDGYTPQYQLTWWTDCTDPTIKPVNTAQLQGGIWVVAWGNIDVSATTPCGEPIINSITCDNSGNLAFSWQMTGRGAGPYNIASYALFRSQAPDSSPDDNYIESISTTLASGSKSWGGLSPGATYYVRVSAVSPQGLYSAPAYSNVVCGSNTPPPEPTKNPVSQVCNGTNVNVTFNWNTVSGATNYRLEIWDPGGVWTSNSHEGGGPTGWAYQDTGGSISWTWWNFPSNSGQTWTARAYRDGLWSDINLSTIIGFTTINCTTPVQPTNATGVATCPFASLVVNFSWAEGSGSNETNYDIEVSTSSTFGTKSTKRLGQNVTLFDWTSANPMDSGSPLTPAYSTAYYARIRAYNSSSNLYSAYVNFSLFPITGLPSSSCSAPKVKLTVFADRDNDGAYDGTGEDFNNGVNVPFSSSVATIVQSDNAIDSDVTSNISAGGTRTGDVTAGTFAYYKITVASNWVLTNYVSDKLPLASPTCTANPCAYSALSPPATGRWISVVNQTWDLKLGMRSTTSTMNVTVFYDKDSDGVVDAGENFTTNPTFGTSVAQIIENGGPYFEQDRTGSFTSAGALSPAETVNSGSMRQFKVVPAVGWVLTYYRSDRTTQQLTTCGANTACTYNQGWTRSYTTTGGETFNFWLGVNTAVPANPGAGPPGTGDCNGTNLWVTLTWIDNATFETGYFLEVYSNSTYTTLVGTKTFAANTRTFLWKNPGMASEKLDNGVAPAYGARYYWRIQARNNSSTSAWVYPNSNGTGQLAPSTNPTAMPALSECTPPADPSNLGVSSACSNGVVTVTFTFTDNATNEAGYILDVTTGGTWTTWGGKYLNAGAGGTQTFVWKNSNNASENLSFPDADPGVSGNQIAPDFGKTYKWRVVAYNVRSIYSNHAYPAPNTFSTPTIASCSAPANPSSPTVTLTCPGGLPSLLFSWTDNANNDTEYYVDINGAAWTGASSPSPWGVKTLTGNGATTGAMSWTWSSTAPVDTGGDTDPVTAGNQLTPQLNKTYWWRVIARNNNTSPALFSSHIYPNGGIGTVDYTQAVSVTPNCSPNLVISAFSVPGGNVGASVSASVTVQNTGASATPVGFEVAIRMNDSTISCGASKDHFTSTGVLAAGGSSVLSIPVTIPSAFGTLTAVAMADSAGSLPNCAVTESNEGDNTRTATYLAQGFDLSTTVVGLDREPASYKDNQTAYFKISITNNGNVASPASGVNLGVWPKGGSPLDNTAYPNCPGTSSTAPTDPAGKVQTYAIAALNAGQTVLLDGTVNSIYSFNVGNAPGPYTLKSYVIYNCASGGNDANWSNNGSDCVSPCTNISKTYSVTVDTWFSGSGGGVGSQGSVSVSRTPSPGNQSNYIVAAGGTISSNVVSPRKISGHSGRLVPTIVYPYLKEVFYDTAVKKASVCNFASHNVGSTPEASSNYCNSNATFGAGSAVPSGVAFWFIDGNLDITQDVVIPSASSALVIVVRDNVWVHTNVKKVDAIIVAGGTFHAQTSDEDFIGAQLEINGAVYTNQSDLQRILGGGAGVCGSVCDNAQYPAIVFTLDPKYLVILREPMGVPAVGWKEVAP